MNARTILKSALLAATFFGLPIVAHPAPSPAAHAGRLAGISGAGGCSLWVQNLDESQLATIIVDFYKQGGGGPVPITRPAIGALDAAEVDLATEPMLQNGAYTAITSSDREIGVVHRCMWPTRNASVMSNGSPPDTDVIVPLAMKSYENQTSLISIQNSDTGAAATIAVELYRQGQAQPLATVNIMVAPGTSSTIDVGKQPAFATVPPGTVGYFRVRSNMPVAVNHIVDVESSSKGVFASEGLPMTVLSDTLYAPLVHAAAPYDPADASSPALDTTMMVVNPGATAADVTIRYAGVSGTCQGQTYTHPAFTLAAGSSALVAHAPGASFPPTGASPLPAGCNASAVIEATGGVVAASVVDRIGLGTMAAGYNAVGAAHGGLAVGLPLFRRNHAFDRSNTAVQVMNVGAAPANVTLEIRDASGNPIGGCGAACTASIPPGQAHLWWPPSIAALGDNMLGSAVVTSDQPVAVVVTDISLAGTVDMASYAGVARRPSGGAGIPGPEYSPLLLNSVANSPNPQPTWTPRPTVPASATPMATATSMVTATPIATATPINTPLPTSTFTPSATRRPTDTPMPTPTPMPTSTVPPPPTDTPAPTPTSAAGHVSDAVRSKVPMAVINAALARPERIAGWHQPRDPGKPVGPFNPLRECLTLVDPGKPYHPLFNGLVFKAGCP